MNGVVLKLLSHTNHFDFPKMTIITLLKKKGFNVSLVTEVDDSDDVYIFFFPPDGKLPKHYICYNLEQLQRGGWDHLIGYLEGAILVWDYSMKNVHFLEDQHDLHARYLPLGCLASEYTDDSPVSVKQRDVLFYGCHSPRRDEYLQNFVEAYASSDRFLFAKWNLWGDDLEREIRDSIVILNVHNMGDHTILESHRLIPLLAKGAYIISERSSDEHADARFKDVVNFVDSPEEMYDEAQRIIKLCKEDRSSYEAEVKRRKMFVNENMNFEPNFNKEIIVMSQTIASVLNIHEGSGNVLQATVPAKKERPTDKTHTKTITTCKEETKHNSKGCGNTSTCTWTHVGLFTTILLGSILSSTRL